MITATPEAAADLRGGSSTPVDALSAAGVGGLTLAELQAVVAFAAPAQLGRLQPLLALAPLVAQRRGASVGEVYGMQSGDVFEAGMAELSELLTDDAVDAARAAMQQAWVSLDPARMRQRMAK